MNDKLIQIKPTLREWRPAFRKSRMEKVIISRPYKTHPLVHPQAGTTTTVFDMPDALHH